MNFVQSICFSVPFLQPATQEVHHAPTSNTLYLIQYIQHSPISTCNQYKICYILFLLPSLWNLVGVYFITYNTFGFGLVTFQVLDSHTWSVASKLDSTASNLPFASSVVLTQWLKLSKPQFPSPKVWSRDQNISCYCGEVTCVNHVVHFLAHSKCLVNTQFRSQTDFRGGPAT